MWIPRRAVSSAECPRQHYNVCCNTTQRRKPLMEACSLPTEVVHSISGRSSYVCAQAQAVCAGNSQAMTNVQDLSPLAALPDHLLAAVLSHACSTAASTVGPPAAGVVRNCAQVTLVCRRFRALLREHPPLLSLNFVLLTPAHISWLASKMQFCFVRAAFFGEQSGECFWNGPHRVFLANQAHTLRELSGLPCCLVAQQPGDEPSELMDLSGSAITRLTLTRCSSAASLVAARLPASLQTLVLIGHLIPAWLSAPGAEPPGCLANLREIECRALETCLCALAGLGRPGVLLSLRSYWDVTFSMSDTPSGQFCGNALRVQARRLTLEAKGMSPAQVLDMLCAPGLQEVCLECIAQHAPILKWSSEDGSRSWCVRDARAVCKLFLMRGSEFAFEVTATRMAWRRWPPAGTPAWVARNEHHEAALAWCGGPFACLDAALKGLKRAAEMP